MATWTNQSKNSATFTNESKGTGTTGGGGIVIGNPIGLLLSLTYAATHGGTLVSIWSKQSKSSSTWTNQTKN